MSTQIYYFSGTGNSAHIANELATRLEDVQLTPMISAEMNHTQESDADIVGFVFPIHCFSIPAAVKRFLSEIKISANAYLFAVSSRHCSVKVFDEMDAVLLIQGKKLNGCFTIQMPQTYLPMFDVDKQEEIEKKEAGMLKELDFIENIIKEKQTYRKADTKIALMYIFYAIRPIIMFLYDKTKYFNLGNRFYVDDACIGCGKCSKICLSCRINMKANRPVWDKNIACIYCLACIHYCPAQAIQIKRTKTKTKGRYYHPAVSASQIMIADHGTKALTWNSCSVILMLVF